MGHIRILTVIGLVVILAACVAPRTELAEIDPELVEQEAALQREYVLRSFAEMDERLQRLALPLWAAAVPLCGERVALYEGWRFETAHDVGGNDDEWRDAKIEVLGLGERPRTTMVVAGSPADAAGIQRGDLLVSVENWPVPEGSGAVQKVNDKLDELAAAGDPSWYVAVQRGTTRLDVTIRPFLTCDYPIYLAKDGEIGASANGRAVRVTDSMMRFATNDTHLSAILAHELAHNLMDHIGAKTTNASIGMVFDILAAVAGVNTQALFSKMAGGAHSQSFEAEADYIGLHIMAMANLDIEGAPSVWREMSTQNVGAIEHAVTHPTNPERFLALERTIVEIQEKQRARVDLAASIDVPDLPAWSDESSYEIPDREDQARKGATKSSDGGDDEESADAE